MTTPKLVSAVHDGDYRIRLRFEDGTEGVVNLESQLWGTVFEPLRDKQVFSKFRLDEELQTITWPTGADLAPEFLYEEARKAA